MQTVDAETPAWILKAHLLPAFGPLPLDRIAPADVHRWFDEYSRTALGGANRTLDLLRRILNHAVLCGHLDMNPARGVKRNPRPRLTRFLSLGEVRRLHDALDRCTRERPSRGRQADIIRLLLLTGCRKNEIVTLRRQDVDGDTVKLSERQDWAETGVPECARPRHPGAPAAVEQRLRNSLVIRSGAAAVVRPAPLVPRAQGSRDGGRAPS